MISFVSNGSLNMLPPRVDLESKPKTPKGKGKNVPIPTELKAPAVRVSNDEYLTSTDNFLNSLEYDNKITEMPKFSFVPERDKAGVKSSDGTITLSFKASDWLFTQVTAISSVLLHEGSKFLIDPATAKFVNGNANCWTDDTVRKYYRSFVGAHNFKDHEQDKNKSYGVVIDAVLRPMRIAEGKTLC